MGGKALIIFLLGIISISVTAFRNIFDSTKKGGLNATVFYEMQQARNIAESGREMAAYKLRNSADWNTLNGVTEEKEILGGTVKYSYSWANFYTGPSTPAITCMRITSLGITQSNTYASVLFIQQPPPPTGLMTNVRAVVGAATNVVTRGNITVDGMNHTTTGVVLPGSGTFAVWAAGDVDDGGSTNIGGTLYSTYPPPTDMVGTDYVPPSNNSNLIKENAGIGFPTDPDSLFGYNWNSGKLKAIAQIGSLDPDHKLGQYVTDPSRLVYPLRGVTYVELGDGVTWNPAVLSGTGVLIVHNSSYNADVKCKKDKDPLGFTGVVVADKVSLFHGNVTGALVVMSKNPADQILGNGSGLIQYSRGALQIAANAGRPLGGVPIQDLILARWDGKWTSQRVIPTR